MSKKLTYEEVFNFFDKYECVLLSETYINNRTKLNFICSCGNEYEKCFDSFKKAPYCKSCGYKICAEKQKHSFEYVYEFFINNSCELLSTEYKNSKEELDYVCECGELSKISFDSFRNGSRCKQCGDKRGADIRRKYSIVTAKEIFKQNGCILLAEEYRNNLQPLKYICVCGTKSSITLNDFIEGHRCQRCKAEKLSRMKKGVERPDFQGEKHPQWKEDKPHEERVRDRTLYGYKQWRLAVFERDKYTCQCCGDSKGGNLVAHHKDGWDWCKEKRHDVDNGITLCNICHNSFHKIYGFGGNTLSQFNEYLSSIFVTN